MLKLRSTKPFVILSIIISVFLSVILLFTGWIAGSFHKVDPDAYREIAAKDTLPDYVETALAQLDDKSYWKDIDDRKAKLLAEEKAREEERKKNRKQQEARHFFPPEEIAATDAVDDSYFNDALFVGDSLMVNLSYSGLFENATFIAAVNLSYENIDDPIVVQTQESVEVPIWQLLEATRGEFKKVYSLLGINSILYGSDENIRSYFERLKELYPDAIIYIESVLPTSETGLITSGKSNELIKEYNSRVYKICQEMGLHYLDTASAIMDNEGRMPDDYAPGDGIHPGTEASYKIRDYIYTHTLEE